MPWSNQGGGGGPWGGGGGGQNPWNRGGGSQPDFEEMIRRSQDRFRRMMPRGFGGGRGVLLGVLALVAVWLLTGFYRVQPDEQGVVLRFGRYVGETVGPGLHYHLPAPIETVMTPSVTSVNRIDIGFVGAIEGRSAGARDLPEESLMLTGDENIVDLDFTVLWRISDAPQFLFNIREPEETVKAVAESAMREVIGQTEIQPALNEARAEIEQRTRQLTQGVLDQYGSGIEIVQVQLQGVNPPEQVVDAFNEVLRAQQDRERLRNEAEAYRNDIIPRARGDAERVVQEASAYREQVINQAQGDAQRFNSVLGAYQVAPAVTAERFYLETMEEVLSGVNKVIIDGNVAGSGGQGVVPYLPLDQLRRAGTAADGRGGQ